MDDRIRVYELARKINRSNQDVITRLRQLGFDIKGHTSTIDKQTVEALISSLNKNPTVDPNPSVNESRVRKRLPPDEDIDENDRLKGAPVPKKPYPGDDYTAVSIPLPVDEDQ